MPIRKTFFRNPTFLKKDIVQEAPERHLFKVSFRRLSGAPEWLPERHLFQELFRCT
jgi:hypothetical protein